MTDKDLELAGDLLKELLNELESQMFLEGKVRCTNCGLLDDSDKLIDGICSDCIPRTEWNAIQAMKPKFHKKEVTNDK